MPTLRTCNTCEIQKVIIGNFKNNRNAKNPNTYRHRCIDCDKDIIMARNRAYYLKKREKVNNN